MLQKQHAAFFGAFDVYPTAKGASTHIYHNASALFEYMKGGWLQVLGGGKLKPYQMEGDIEISRFDADIPAYLSRAQAFSDSIYNELKNQHELKICHYRDIWSGLPVIYHRNQYNREYKTLYEINGLHSVELPYRYPRITDETLEKIRNLEKICAFESDHILCPSEIIKGNIIEKLQVSPDKITVISNGADLPETFRRPARLPKKYIIYFGALQNWQGIHVLLKAFTYLNDFEDLKLVICSSLRARQSKYYKKMAEKLGISGRIIWHHQLKKKPLYNWVHFAEFSVAPLTECSRNLDQGCCPLKILESMALSTPVLASDLPAIREIIRDEELGFLLRADRPAELGRMMRVLLENPNSLKKIGENARQFIKENYSWNSKKEALKKLYEKLLKTTPTQAI